MNQNILVVYKSKTGFTKKYAEMIGEELDCKTADLNNVTDSMMSEYDTIVFGGRFHAGFVDGLKKAKEYFKRSSAAKLVVFATGATPHAAKAMIEEAWKNNFTAGELESIPHFYMPSGLCYERMSLGDKLMMKVFVAMMKRKKNKNEDEKNISQAISHSYDISSKEYIMPLISLLRGE